MALPRSFHRLLLFSRFIALFLCLCLNLTLSLLHLTSCQESTGRGRQSVAHYVALILKLKDE